MKENCRTCKRFFECYSNYKKLVGNPPIFPLPLSPCFRYEFAKKHDFVLIHKRFDSGFYFIVAFDDDFDTLIKLRNHLPEYGKKNHDFYVVSNRSDSRISSIVNDIKDGCLLNICKNVAYSLSRAEYSMLKKKYSRSKFCFDRAKSMILDACYILENY